MEVHFGEELEAKVNRVAAENHSGPDEYAKLLGGHYLDHDAWFRKRVRKGLNQLDRGAFIIHEEMGERIEQMFRR